ncbi:MAG: 4-hydroxythreonine-4-phosphate dehydrogenase PdxA [Deltaproteobacteria bacterium]|nr:4-hydroxythreonine-4-phosphate dehydrogenase PdxA [Deltaproteobacteria bacterium]
MQNQVRLAVTLGDPAGIGPEVVELAAIQFLQENTTAKLIIIGPDNIVKPLCAKLGPRSHAESIAAFTAARGMPSAASGQAALSTLARAITLAQQHTVEAIVTAPINKLALAMAGSTDRGHTEILARELGVGPTAMSFFTQELRVVLATTHLPLQKAISTLTAERIVEVTQLLNDALKNTVPTKVPKLALAALNPHAGEAGLLGNEEKLILAPAVKQACALGIDLSGPFPADTLFYRARNGEFDGVVSLYHDQALIPIKLLSFGQAVNVTLGLATPRTSPDHGTAYDKIGSPAIKHNGMLGALHAAVSLVHNI